MQALFRDLATLPLLGDDLPAGGLGLAHLRRAVSHEGGLNRLRCFAAKLRAGNNVSIAVLGGSVSAGSSSRVRPDQSGLYHRKLQRWLQSRFPGHVGHINAAMPAVPPGYMWSSASLFTCLRPSTSFSSKPRRTCAGVLGARAPCPGINARRRTRPFRSSNIQRAVVRRKTPPSPGCHR